MIRPFSSPSEKQVAVVVGEVNHYVRSILRGILRFGQEHADWTFHTVRHQRIMTPTLLGWRPVGVIANIRNWAMAEELGRLQLPTVNISSSLEKLTVPRVQSDHDLIGKLAAEHLLGLGLQGFGFVGTPGLGFSEARREAFARRLAEAGVESSRFDFTYYPSYDELGRVMEDDVPLRDWLRGLRRPAGLFCSNDDHAFRVLDVCRRTAVRVPEDVAVLGVDNDEIFCELNLPTLSSIDWPIDQLGYRAAGVLTRLVAGEPVPNRSIISEGTSLVARDSTAGAAIVEGI